MDRELRAIVIKLEQPFYFDEIVAVEGIHDLGDVIPHLGVNLTAAIRQQHGEIRLSRALLPDLLCVNKKYRGSNFVRFQFAHERRLH